MDDGSIPGDFSLRAVSSFRGFSLSATGPLSLEWDPGTWDAWAAEPDWGFLSPLLSSQNTCVRFRVCLLVDSPG